MTTATLELSVGQWTTIVRGLKVLARQTAHEESSVRIDNFASEIEELVIVQTK
jgi:hypothetical protein